jgi:hypothetical protein
MKSTRLEAENDFKVLVALVEAAPLLQLRGINNFVHLPS